MSLLSRIGNGMKTAGRFLPVLATGIAVQQDANAQAFVPLPGVGIGKGANRINMGVYVGPDGPQTTLSGNGGYVILPPIKGNDSSQQQQNQNQQQQYSQKRIEVSKVFLWKDFNDDGLMQQNEILDGEPRVGVEYYPAFVLKNARGVPVKVSVGEDPPREIVAATDDTVIRQPITFRDTRPLKIRFDVLDGYSWRIFRPREE
jgi:hypothetical protein